MTTLPDVFLPYQQDLWRAVDTHAVTVVEKSRRTGFSWAAGAIAAGAAGATRSAGGSDVLYMGYDADMTREFIDYVADWGKSFQLAASAVDEFLWVDTDRPEKAIKAFRVTFASGYEVVALPSVPRALRGKQGLVILDEAAFMDDLDAVLKAAFALLIWGGKVLVISTHNGDTNPFNTLVTDIRAGRLPYHLMRLTFDEALEQGLYKRICFVSGKTWSPAAEAEWKASILKIYANNADEELNVIPNPSTGTFIPLPLIEARMSDGIPVLRWEAERGFMMISEALRQSVARAWCLENLLPILDALDPDRPHVFGFDVARKGDLTVIWVLELGRDMIRRTVLVIELRNMPFGQQRQVLWFTLDGLPRRRGGCMDAGGLGMQIAEETVVHYGATIQAVMLTEPWYREHMGVWKAAFEDGTITIPRDEEVVDDIRAVKLVRGIGRIPQATKATDGQRRHGDAAIASALAYTASCADPEEYDYTAAPRAPQDSGKMLMEAPREWDEDSQALGRAIIHDRSRGAFA